MNQYKLSRRSLLLSGFAGLASFTLPLKLRASVGLFEPFSFAYICDVHLANGIPDSYELIHESQLFLQDVVKQLNLEKLDFVIFGGDQVQGPGRNDSNWQLFLDIVQGLESPWSFILGEADVSGDIAVDKMHTYGADWKGKGLDSGKPYWSMSPISGVHIIGLDTSLANFSQGDISPKQLEWLSQELSTNKRRFNMVFSHHPLLPPPPYDAGSPWDEYTLPQADAVREVLGSSPFVHLCVSGHVHVSKVQHERDIWYVSSPSLAVYPCAYRIFRVDPQQVTVETRQVDYGALIKKARRLLVSSSLAYKYNPTRNDAFASLVEGSREDQNSILVFERGSQAKAINPSRKKTAPPQPKSKKTQSIKSKKITTEKDLEPKNKTPAEQPTELMLQPEPNILNDTKPDLTPKIDQSNGN